MAGQKREGKESQPHHSQSKAREGKAWQGKICIWQGKHDKASKVTSMHEHDRKKLGKYAQLRESQEKARTWEGKIRQDKVFG